ARLTASTRGMVERYDDMVSLKGTDFLSRTPRFHPSNRAPTPHRDDRGRASTHESEPVVLAQQTRRHVRLMRSAEPRCCPKVLLYGVPKDTSIEKHI
ncbi:hypothetical protein B296_00030953, partial [Ensete ventricosum]